MGLSKRGGKPNMDKNSYSVPGRLLEAYREFGIHAQVLEKKEAPRRRVVSSVKHCERSTGDGGYVLLKVGVKT
jgi:hypothetical protein